MLILCVVVVSILLGLYIITTHYILKRDMYVAKDTVQRLCHDAFQDSRNAANFKTSQLMLSVEAISSAICTIENIVKLYGPEEANALTELDLASALVRMKRQKKKIMEHASELYPDITPSNPSGEKPTFEQNFEHFESDDDEEEEDASTTGKE